MSLGDYEHTYKVVLEVTVRSKTRTPDTDRMQDPMLYFESDGVDITTIEDLLPPEVRRAIGE